jgi:hypothetical protein
MRFVVIAQLIEKLAHQNRERIPEPPRTRQGLGRYGTHTITSTGLNPFCAWPGAQGSLISPKVLRVLL